MTFRRLIIEVHHRAADMEFILVSVGTRSVEQPQELQIEDLWEEDGIEGVSYFISWSTPRPKDFDLKIAAAVKDQCLRAEDVAQLCHTAERLASDPAEAARWPYKIVFDDDLEPLPLSALDQTQIN